MTVNTVIRRSGSLFVALVAAPATAWALSYSVVAIPGLVPHALNDHGAVAGSCDVGRDDLGNPVFHACVRQPNGTITDLGTLGGKRSAAYGINNRGDVVGWSDIAGDTAHHAFVVLSGAAMTDMLTLGGTSSTAYAINESRQIAGSSDIAGDTEEHVFLASPTGAPQDLGTLGGRNAIPRDINESGVIVGASTLPGGTTLQAFVSRPGLGMNELDTFDGRGSDAFGINDSGDIVGTWTDRHGLTQAFFRSARGAIRPLDALPGLTQSTASDVNNHGTVVGYSVMHGDFGVPAGTRWRQRVPRDLTEMMPAPIWVRNVVAVNDAEEIVGYAYDPYGYTTSAVLLTPIPRTVSDLIVSPSPVPGCSYETTGQVSIFPIFTKRTTLHLRSSNDAASVPRSVVIPKGETTVEFPIAITPPATTTETTITASELGSALHSHVTIKGVAVASMTLDKGTAIAGETVGGTVALGCPAPSPGVYVQIVSGAPRLVVPDAWSVFVPPGQYAARFSVTVAETITSPRTVAIRGKANESTKSATLVLLYR